MRESNHFFFRGCEEAYCENIADKSFSNILCNDKIDVVYTWVNGSDPIWLKTMLHYKHIYERKKLERTMNDTNKINLFMANISAKDHNIDNRFRDMDELKYSIRSLFKYAPWIHHIYLVTDNQIPNWLDLSKSSKISIITHDQIFPNKSHLPTFSSPSIESHLHLIPNLSEYFIYFNDDVFLGNYIYPDDFYTKSQGYKIYQSWDLPKCHEGCLYSWLGDGYCDKLCNTKECNFDGGDCGNSVKTQEPTVNFNPTPNIISPHSGNNNYNNNNYTPLPTKQKLQCNTGCIPTWIGDKVCDNNCNNLQCGYDGPDCGIEVIINDLPFILFEDDIYDYTLEYENEIFSFYIPLEEYLNDTCNIINGYYYNEEYLYHVSYSEGYKTLIFVIDPGYRVESFSFIMELEFDTKISFFLNLINI